MRAALIIIIISFLVFISWIRISSLVDANVDSEEIKVNIVAKPTKQHPKQNCDRDADHWNGKMEYYLSIGDVFDKYNIEIPDSIWRKVEHKYSSRSKEHNYDPYP